MPKKKEVKIITKEEEERQKINEKEIEDSYVENEWLDDKDIDETTSYTDAGEEEETLEEDPEKLEFIDIKKLELGMSDVNVIGKIDFVGDKRGSDYGSTLYVVGFIKDKTGEVKTSFWDDDAIAAKPGKKVRIIHGNVTEYNGQIQLNPHKRIGVKFL